MSTLIGAGWYYLDSNYHLQGPFSPKHMAHWKNCGMLDEELLCRTSYDTEFHTITEWKSVCGAEPFAAKLQSYEEARAKLFKADTEVNFTHTPPVHLELIPSLEREHCERLFKNIIKIVLDDEPEPEEPPAPTESKKITVQPVVKKPKRSVKPKLSKKPEISLSSMEKYFERPAQQLLPKYNRPKIEMKNPWTKANNRRLRYQAEDWHYVASSTPWIVSRSNNRIRIETESNLNKTQPTKFPTIHTAEINDRIAASSYEKRFLELRKKSEEEHEVSTSSIVQKAFGFAINIFD